jgi:hypothetical protein
MRNFQHAVTNANSLWSSGRFKLMYDCNCIWMKLFNFVDLETEPTDTPVSYDNYLRDLQGLMYNRLQMSSDFSSVSTLFLRCCVLSSLEPVVHHFLIILHTLDFVGTDESVFADETVPALSVSSLSCICFNNYSLVSSVHHWL